MEGALVCLSCGYLSKGIHFLCSYFRIGGASIIAHTAHQINEEIHDKEVRLISAQGEQLGIMPLAEAMAKAGIETLDTLVSKEGLGMTNGTCAMTSVGALALYDTICAAQLGDVIASMSFEGLTGLRNAFDPRIHQVRGQKGQMLVAANMRKLLDGSEILDN